MSADQTTLFDLLPPPPQQDLKPDLGEVRRYLYDLLATARAAERMPWEPPQMRTKCNMMRQMTVWLPTAEAESLRAAFAVEMDRLGIDR